MSDTVIGKKEGRKSTKIINTTAYSYVRNGEERERFTCRQHTKELLVKYNSTKKPYFAKQRIVT